MAKKQSSSLPQKIYQYRMTLIVVVLVLIVVFALFGANMRTISDLKEQRAQIEERIADAKAESEQLDEDLKGLGTKSYIEEIAREYLNLYYPDEQIVLPSDGTSREKAK